MDFIEVLNATQNNLRGVSVSIPVGKITAFTGVSGSGKSSLVFGVLAAESQRQLNFTYPAYVRNRLPHGGTPQVDHISGLSTAIIIDQKAIGTNNRSTVGTATDAAPLLRLIMSRMGKPFVGYSNVFSFNDPAGMCPRCKGLGVAVDVDENELIDLDKSINEGAFRFAGYAPGTWYWKWYKRTGLFDADRKLRDYSKEDLDTLLYSEPTPLKNPPADWYATAKYEGVIHRFRSMYLGNASEGHKKRFAEDLDRIIHQTLCPDCKGARLNQRALSCRIDGQNIDDLCRLSIEDLRVVVEGWAMPEVAPAVENLGNQLSTLVDLGLGYLQLGRGTTTLSGGEAQRIKMVRHLGSSLTRFTYILDEPSTGLHPRDVRHLGEILKRLRDKGNTVLLVEHDPDLINIADFVVDMGPGPGAAGGKILFTGSLAELKGTSTPTGDYFRTKREFTSARKPQGDPVSVRNARRNNLQAVSVDIPRHVLTALTGVAGSGKSSLIKEILAVTPSAQLIDQSPLRGSTTSTVATYTGVMERIRDLFARANGVSRSWFTNASKGACPVCKGRGAIVTELAFLDSTEMTCEVCHGTGFNAKALGYRFDGQMIADVLAMSVDQAVHFLKNHDQESAETLERLQHVGLGYLTIGRSTSTLSGGERQRVKLAALLDEDVDILILDEPTTGLHGSDVTRLLGIIKTLVERGVTVLMVEHNLDAMLAADWIIDLGPGAGTQGGKVMYAGPASQILKAKHTVTGEELRRYVEENTGKKLKA
ncbi:excinuclease ABC subunit A [Acetobacter cibinongensis]|uniref:UvrABC system protein A n=1 Tax=Acetobacter cibinongensis TaxID=146475 RepID=A0A0D6N1F0_9PROT|nr:excinuclease ABC subunit UvrA [Acetobacter cibinongensis]GAN59388.1 excinuclease ABC subunit A [Acetobacter cibinongensis]GBQ15598.1 ABC transporter related protein [Acetobacter cibinongensis NRIC 0482]GEL59732.1 excinuclease ABC subunit A [Acetobacter cibinongensis]